MYSSVADMIARFGQAELIRLTTPPDQDMETIQPAALTRALVEASALIDTYLRGRYTVPVVDVLPELTRAAAFLARYDLAQGEQKQATEQMRLDRKEVLAWLELIRDGKTKLDLLEAPAADQSVAISSSRDAVYQ
jgi:phage gp36-like protein